MQNLSALPKEMGLLHRHQYCFQHPTCLMAHARQGAIVTVATFLDGNLAKFTEDDAEALLFSEEE
jgi:hypothetical protein